MAEFLKGIASFFDFQKVAGVSVSGLIMAFAIVLMYYALTPPQLFTANEILAFDGETVKALRLPEPCNTLLTDARSLRGGAGRLDERDWQWLNSRRFLMENCSQQLRNRVVLEQNSIAKLTASIEANQKLSAAFMKQYEEYSLKGIPLADRYSRLATQALAAANKDREAAKHSEGLIAVYNDLLARVSADLKTLVDRVRAAEQDEPFADLVTRLTSRLMYLVLFGVVVGVALDPIMRQLQQLLYTKGRVYRFNLTHDGAPVAVGNARMPEDNVNYALGLGLIKQEDVDALDARYNRSAQFGLSLVLPLAVLLVAIGLYVDKRVLKQDAIPALPAQTQTGQGRSGG
jgi:hypothetical protein